MIQVMTDPMNNPILHTKNHRNLSTAVVSRASTAEQPWTKPAESLKKTLAKALEAKRRMRRTLFLVALVMLHTAIHILDHRLDQSGCARAQDWTSMDVTQIDELSFEQILDLDLLQVASKKPLSKKDVPGVVTLIKREEIQLSGARDLVDVLRLVPGFEFGGDIQGIVGLGTRGNWAHEGKALVMIDGVQVNDFLFATTPICNRFALEQIERIEIIRGPGSSFYGGFAELAVINIITRAAADINGIALSSTAGVMEHALGRAGATLSFGKKFDEVSIAGALFWGQANTSDRTYTGLDSISFPMSGVHTIMPVYANLRLQAGAFQASLMYDRYNTTMRSGIGTTLPETFSTNFTALLADARYDWMISDKITITPRLNYTRQQPWRLTDSIALPPTSPFNFLVMDKTVERFLGSLTISADVSEYLFFTLGSEFYLDRGTASPLDPLFSLWFDERGNRTRSISYTNIGVYLQSLITTPVLNVNAGLRMDKHSAVEIAFVPWLGVTKTIGNFNFKALFGQNFRAPSIENIRLNPRIRPERTTAFELEVGYQFQYNMFAAANIFDVSIQDAIIFGGGGYINYARTRTRGIEAEYFFRDEWGSINLSYSFYLADENEFPDSIRMQNPYRVWNYTTTPDGKRLSSFADDRVLLGFAPHKLTLNAVFHLSRLVPGLSISPSAIWLGERYGLSQYRYFDGIQEVRSVPPVLLLNVFAQYKDAFGIEGLTLGAGVYNALNDTYDFVQPYNAGNALLPGPSREVLLKISYLLRW